MNKFEDKHALVNELMEGEKVLWKSKAAPFELLGSDAKKSIMNRWIVCALLAVAVIGFYLSVSLSGVVHFNATLLVLLVLVFAYCAAVPVLDRRNIQKKCRYYVTDKRVILCYGDNEVHSLSRAGLRCSVVESAGGTGHVVLGGCVEEPAKKMRVRSFAPLKDDKEAVCGFVFYSVPEIDTVREYFAS